MPPATHHDDTTRREADLRLAQRAADGDRGAQEEVVIRVMARVRATVGYLLGPTQESDDIIQQVLIEIVRGVHTYAGFARLETWADRIAVRTTMRAIKRHRWRERVVRLWPGELPEVADEGGMDDEVMVRRRLASVLQKIAPERRVALVLRLVHEYSVREIAELTNAPLNTVRDRLRVGREALRKAARRDPVLGEWAAGVGR